MRLTFICGVLLGAIVQAQTSQPAADQQRDRAQVIAREIAKEVETIRGLRFKRPVKVGTYTTEQLKKTLKTLMAKEMPPARLRPYERGLKAMELIPRDYGLQQGITKLLESQIAGFYDPESKELRLIDRSAAGPEVKGGMSGLMGGGADMDPEDMDRIVMAHELTHALQDQHFDLESLPLAGFEDDDLITAVKSVVEGDATVLMMAWVLKDKLDAKPGTIFARGGMIRLGMKLMERQALSMLSAEEDVPPFLSVSLVFPYLEGLSLCLAAGKGKRGFKGVDRTWATLPLSTEQVLHPDKLLGEKPDWPMVLDLPDLATLLGPRAARVTSNSLGELYTRVLFEDKLPRRTTARRVAKGWDGDRYVLYEHGPERSETVVWASTWDTARDADQMEEALIHWIENRPDEIVQKQEAAWARAIVKRRDGSVDAIGRRGQDLVLVLHGPANAAAGILEKVLTETKRTERRKVPRGDDGR